jgi:hypothetical protein
MSEVVHCKSKKEVGVAQAAATCAEQHLNDLLSVTSAPVVVVVGRMAHLCLNGTVGLELPEPPYITSRGLGGRERLLVFIWHPAGFKGPKKLAGLHGEAELRHLRDVLGVP